MPAGETAALARTKKDTPEVADALALAFERIVAYHAFEGTPPGDFESAGVTVSHLTRPVDRVGLYAPGGRRAIPRPC